MKIHDISVPVKSGGFVFPGDPEVHITPFLQKESGDLANVSLISMGTHTGTHIDPPLHLWDDGKGADALPLESLVGEAVVVDLSVAVKVTAADLKRALLGMAADRLLIKTRNSALWAAQGFTEDFVYLSADGAEWLAQSRLKLVGFDYLSIEKFDASNLAAHETLLRSGTVILEGLDLSNIEAGVYQLVCLPLKIENGDGAPARAILIEK